MALPRSQPQQRPAPATVPTRCAIKRSARFVVNADGSAPLQARAVARSLLTLCLTNPNPERTIRRVQTCLSELVAVAYTRAHDDTLLCALWLDTEHVFISVEHAEPLPATPGDCTLGLNVVKTIADDYGSHVLAGGYQMWAAIRMI